MTHYHWCPPTVRVVTRVVVSPRLLSTVKGFSPLGTFFLGDEFDVSKAFTKLLTETERGGNPEPTTLKMLADLMAKIVEPSQGAFMQFFSFPVLSNSPSRVLGDGLFPVWKWVKPESIYFRKGFWEANLSKVLDHGEWNGGRDLVILAVGVAEGALQIILSGDRSFPVLGDLLTK